MEPIESPLVTPFPFSSIYDISNHLFDFSSLKSTDRFREEMEDTNSANQNRVEPVSYVVSLGKSTHRLQNKFASDNEIEFDIVV